MESSQPNYNWEPQDRPTEEVLSKPIDSQRARPVEVLKHIPALDGIRGTAIVLVLICHFFWANNRTPFPLYNFLQRVTITGWVGVDLFFVLSGFLITGILFDSRHDKHYFKSFYGRRVLRIFPLYYLVVLAVGMVFHASVAADFRPLLFLLFDLQNTPMWFRLPGSPLVNAVPHLWSLATEEQFYLIWPLIIFLVRRRRSLMWVAGLSVLAVPVIRTVLYAHGVTGNVIYVMTICRADSLLSGAWLALMVRGESREKVLRLAPYAFWAAVAGCLWVAYSGGGFDGNTVPLIRYGYTVLAVAMTSLLAMSLRRGSKVEAIFRNKGLRIFGKYSYGIYMLHEFVFDGLKITVFPWIRAHVVSLVFFHLIIAPLSAGFALLAAMVSFRFYEQPFLRMKNRFNYQRDPTKTKTPELRSKTDYAIAGRGED